jgi:hypothetical protein
MGVLASRQVKRSRALELAASAKGTFRQQQGEDESAGTEQAPPSAAAGKKGKK